MVEEGIFFGFGMWYVFSTLCLFRLIYLLDMAWNGKGKTDLKGKMSYKLYILSRAGLLVLGFFAAFGFAIVAHNKLLHDSFGGFGGVAGIFVFYLFCKLFRKFNWFA